MRILNLVGSVVFVVYGSILPAISTAVLNGVLIIVKLYYVIKMVIDHKKQKQTQVENNKVNETEFIKDEK